MRPTAFALNPGEDGGDSQQPIIHPLVQWDAQLGAQMIEAHPALTQMDQEDDDGSAARTDLRNVTPQTLPICLVMLLPHTFDPVETLLLRLCDPDDGNMFIWKVEAPMQEEANEGCVEETKARRLVNCYSNQAMTDHDHDGSLKVWQSVSEG